MKLLSVNVSMPKEVPYRGGMVSTGIFKEPVTGRVMLRRLNLDGDKQADPSVHGGVHKAAYAYPFEHYEWWSRELARTDFAFGQNLEDAKKALRLSSLAPEWRTPMEKRLIQAGIPLE